MTAKKKRTKAKKKRTAKKRATKKRATKKRTTKKRTTTKRAKKRTTKAAPKKRAAKKRTTKVAAKVAAKGAAKKRTATKRKRRAVERGFKIGTAAFSGDGRILATASGKRVYLWDVTGTAPKKLATIKTTVDASRLAVDQTGTRIAAGVSGFSEVRIRSAETGALLHEIHARGSVTTFGFAPDGRFVIGEVERIGEQGLRVRSFITVVDLMTGEESFRVPIAELPVREIAFSTDGLLLFLGFGGGVVVVFDLDAKRELFRFPSLDDKEIGARIAAAFAFTKDGRRAAIGFDNTVEVWSIDSADRVATIDLGAKAWSVALSQSGDAVIAGAPASGVWSLQGKKMTSLDVAHPVVASPDGKRVLVGEKINLAKGPKLAPAA